MKMRNKIKKILHFTRGDGNFREAYKGSLTNFLIRTGGLFAGYAFTLAISRYFGADVLGAHTLSVTVLMMFTIPVRLGMDIHIVKVFSTARLQNRWDKIGELYKKTLTISIVTGLFFSILLFLFAEYLAHIIFKKPELIPYLKVISFAVLPMALRFINSECYRGFGLNKQYAYSQNVGYFLYALIILGALYSFSKNNLIPNIAFAGSLILLGISSTYLVLKKIKVHNQTASAETSYAEWIKTSSPMMLGGSLLLISGWINTIVLGIYESPSTVGLFAVVIKISAFTNFVLMSVNSVATPKFAQLHGSGQEQELRKYVSLTTRMIFWASLPVFLVLLFGGEWFLKMFGEEFTDGYNALLIVLAGKVIGVLAGSTGNILNMTGHQSAFRNIMLISTLINIILCFLLIPSMGLTGSAIASSAFIITWNIISVIYIKVKLKINTFFSPF